MARAHRRTLLLAAGMGSCTLVLALACVLTACGAGPWGPVAPAQAFILLGAQRQFSLWVLRADGSPLAVSPTWTVIGDIGTVDASGLFTAGDTPGAGEVIATVGTLSESAQVTVGSTPPPEARQLAVSPETLMLDADETDQLVAVYRPDGGPFAWYTAVTIIDSADQGDAVTVTPASGTGNATVVLHVDPGVRSAEVRFTSLTSGSASVVVQRSETSRRGVWR